MSRTIVRRTLSCDVINVSETKTHTAEKKHPKKLLSVFGFEYGPGWGQGAHNNNENNTALHIQSQIKKMEMEIEQIKKIETFRNHLIPINILFSLYTQQSILIHKHL